MNDTVLKIGKNSLLQHGPDSDRIYLMHCDPQDLELVRAGMADLQKKYRYGKIFIKITEELVPLFLKDGYRVEAHVPNFYGGQKDGFFMAAYPDPGRAVPEAPEALSSLHAALAAAPATPVIPPEDDDLTIQPLNEDHAQEMAKIFKTVFATYPFPVHDPEYLKDTMDHVHYAGIYCKSRLAGISSAETDPASSNAEMTDFAVLPEYRGRRMAPRLLRHMEKDMKKMGIATLYTIARLHSPAMNRTFIGQGYHYAGTLTRNTQIFGKIESMNVLYKSLTAL